MKINTWNILHAYSAPRLRHRKNKKLLTKLPHGAIFKLFVDSPLHWYHFWKLWNIESQEYKILWIFIVLLFWSHSCLNKKIGLGMNSILQHRCRLLGVVFYFWMIQANAKKVVLDFQQRMALNVLVIDVLIFNKQLCLRFFSEIWKMKALELVFVDRKSLPCLIVR